MCLLWAVFLRIIRNGSPYDDHVTKTGPVCVIEGHQHIGKELKAHVVGYGRLLNRGGEMIKINSNLNENETGIDLN